MAKIHNLKIQNFRGIKEFEHTFNDQNFICLIGRGDSGKSTILKAISYILSPNWNITFLDNDFHDGDITNNIIIEVTLKEIPDSFVNEDKFGFQLRGIDRETGAIHDELQDNHQKAITIRLTVDKDLEPTWEVVNNRHGDAVKIKATDREKLNTFFIADYIDILVAK
jgi:putative ATP-dependent endonuclease of OLD family